MSFTREELLRPSLRGATPAKAPYSLQTMVLASFFGGPFAAIAMIGANSVLLQRWRQDLLPLGLVLAATLGFLAALHLTPWGAGLRGDLASFAGPRALSYLSRVIGLVIFGIGYVLHRSEQRSADFMGLDRPNGLIGGILCILAGIATSFAVSFLLVVARGL